MSRVVFEDVHLQVMHRAGATDSPFLVTFNEISLRANGSDYWAKSVFERLNLSGLGFVSREPNWFPAKSIDAALRAVGLLLASNQAQVIAYGHSQGAYAALRYGQRLGASTIVAMSPQATIEPAILGLRDKRFTSHFRPELHAGMALHANDISCPAYVFFDPYEHQDAPHIEHVLSLGSPWVRGIPVPSTGHDTVRVFTGSELILRLLNLCLLDETDDVLALARERRKHGKIRILVVARHAAARHPNVAQSLVERYETAFGESHLFRIAEQMAAATPNAAEIILHKSLAKKPTGRAFHLLAFCLYQQARYTDAVIAAHKAVKLEPNVRSVQERLAKYQKKLLSSDQRSGLPS